ncbi:MAG: 4Fe-4S dicluster domain-containing protein [Phycisphaerales bacterium]|nr:MAG: 4Fe-4S dicluster domain-containing protein [Phycisphaerales bacterium]
MKRKIDRKISGGETGFSRREFLQRSEGVAIRTAAGGAFLKLIWLDNAVAAMPAAGGYLLVDTKKCQGCMTCMLACSLVHEGKENLSLARIQVVQNSFAKFPNDITLAQCRQCVEPACLKACPTDALHVDQEHGNVRIIDAEKCTGCMSCVEACPHAPGRAVWDFEDEHAQKCDLCADTPFWNERGGPGGKQACVELCPVAALKFTEEIPKQDGDEGYNINLRGDGWKNLGFPVGSGEPSKKELER